MTSKEYQVFGFTAAKGKPPQFIEPVFICGNSLFVQSGITPDDKIAGFKEFNEGVDLIEQRSDEAVNEGDTCIFAVMESGGRLIYGDRPYVSRYLSQNLRSYMDSPYFLKDCIEFSGKQIPEFSIVESNKDLLELSVAVNSIREFVKQSPNARNRILIDFREGESIASDRRWRLGAEPTAKTIFGEWLLFAERKNHRVARSNRWKDIEKSYLRCYEDNDKLLTFSAKHHFEACRKIISFRSANDFQMNAEVDEIADLADLADLVLQLDVGLDEKDDLDVSNSTRELQLFHGGPVSRERDGITRKLSSWVSAAVSAKKISYVEIMIQVYFLTIAVKTAFIFDKNSEED